MQGIYHVKRLVVDGKGVLQEPHDFVWAFYAGRYMTFRKNDIVGAGLYTASNDEPGQLTLMDRFKSKQEQLGIYRTSVEPYW